MLNSQIAVKDTTGSLQTLKALPLVNMKPNFPLYQKVITVLVEEKRMEAAISLLEECLNSEVDLSKNVVLDLATIVISNCTVEERVYDVINLLQSKCGEDCQYALLDAVSHFYISKNDHERALVVMEKAHDNNIMFSSERYEQLFESALKINRIDIAFSICQNNKVKFKTVPTNALSQKEGVIDDGSLILLLTACSKKGDVEMFDKVASHIEPNMISSETILYTRLIALANAGLWKECPELLQKIHKHHTKSKTKIKYSMLDLLSKKLADQGVETIDRFYFITSHVTQPPSVKMLSYNIVIEACMLIGDYERCISTFSDITNGSAKINLSPILFHYIIRSCCRLNAIDKAYFYMNKMISQCGMMPLPSTLREFVRCLPETEAKKEHIEIIFNNIDYVRSVLEGYEIIVMASHILSRTTNKDLCDVCMKVLTEDEKSKINIINHRQSDFGAYLFSKVNSL
ncbi:hypothetical protein AKO1_008043 [Acrasis kona]|uniref:Pentatricopeptide repeat-containing protein-mitochondrial domain-containing protein n=1 Tax=Acrasis kona TaxID=1008807 RepID=A0AAW2YQ34_9EUKA